MITINLLPWRNDKIRREKKAATKIWLSAFIVPVCVLVAMNWLLSANINDSKSRISFLKQQWRELSNRKQIKFSNNHVQWPSVLDKNMLLHLVEVKKLLLELGDMQTSGLCFTELIRMGNIIYFSGYARSAEELTEYLTHWSSASLFSDMQIDQLQRENTNNPAYFRFHAVERHPFPR